jgi:Domain of unknown function (DUF4838)/TAT (twin-arginine translocation) pathway signal sequence
MLSRRQFLRGLAAAVAAPTTAAVASPRSGAFDVRGVVLIPDDLSWTAWPERAAAAGLTTLALHHGASVQKVLRFIRSPEGRHFLESAHRLGLDVEYELHAMSDLLPREHFAKNKSLFRTDDKGDRVPDCNLCVHSKEALEIAAENAVRIAAELKPTTHRYFYWGDDGQPWCRCPRCKGLADSDQALLLENHLVRTLRRVDSRAQLSHLAYAGTLQPPKQVRPEPGIFLEYAPIHRTYDLPYAEQKGGADAIEALDANLAVFGARHAQVLEYWLDVSRFSGWRHPAVKLPWNEAVFRADLDTYRKRGIRRITSFAVYIDADYVKRYGEPTAIAAYGSGLRGR